MPTSNTVLLMDVASMKTILSRVDVSVEKLTDISKDLVQLVAVHENRISHQEKMTSEMRDQAERRRDETLDNFKGLHDNIVGLKESIHDKIDAQKEDILDKIDENEKVHTVGLEGLQKRMSHLERWMWGVLGGGSVILLLIENFPQFFHFGM